MAMAEFVGGALANPYVRAAAAAAPYMRAAYNVARSINLGSTEPLPAMNGRSGRVKRRRMFRRKRSSKRSGKSSSRMVTKYHERAQTYRKKRFAGRVKRRYGFRKRVINAIAQDGPAKQFVFNTQGVNSATNVFCSIPVASGLQGMAVVGSLYTWAGDENVTGNMSRDCYELLSNVTQANAQAYTNLLGATKAYTDIFDSKIKVEGGFAEVMLNNPSGGAAIIVDLYECICRRDKYGQSTTTSLLASDLYAGTVANNVLTQNGEPQPVTANTTYGVTPFQNDGFVHQWKIVKVTRVRLEPGSSTTYTMSSKPMKTIQGEYFRGVVSGEDEVLGSQVAKRGLTRILVARCFGEPIQTGTGAATLYYNCIRRYTARALNSQSEELALLKQP